MTIDPTEYQLMDLYRSWWKDSYGTVPNSQATIIAAAWAKHVIDCVLPAYAKPTGVCRLAPMDGITPLSPAAQAVIDAAYKRMDDMPHNEVEATLSAALRAAADQLTSAKAIGTLRYIAAQLDGGAQ